MHSHSISVVTICYNNLEDLIKTCDSVDSQSCKPKEHWIINGSSNTRIMDWIVSTKQPSYRKWKNEPDNGITDAFNKGISLCDGAIVHLLNSGDIYTTTDILQSVTDFFSANDSVQWISGKLRLKRSGHWVEVGTPFEKKKLYRGMRGVLHPTWFVKKQVYVRNGGYPDRFKIGMDYDMMCKIQNEPYAFFNKTLATFDDSGQSTVLYLESLKENVMIYESHFGFSLYCRVWQLRQRILHYLLKTVLGKWLFRLKNKV